MKVQHETKNGIAIMRLSGEIKMGESAQSMVNELESLLKTSDHSGILVDLAGINYIDSTGLGEMVGYLEKFKRQDKVLKILNPSERVLKLIKLTRLHEFMDIHDDEAAAIASFS